MKKLILFVFTFLAFSTILPLYAQEAAIKEGESLNLDRCIEIALKIHPTIEGSLYAIKAREAQLGQARANYFPKLDTSAGYLRNFEINNTLDPYSVLVMEQYNNSTANATLYQRIYDFGRTPTNVDIKKLNLDSSRFDFSSNATVVTNNVKNSYYGVLKTQRARNVTIETVNQFKQHLDQAKAMFYAGTKPKYDVIKADVDLSNAQLNLISAENDLKIAWVTLNNAMGIDSVAEYKIEDNLAFAKYELTMEDALQKAYQNRPDLKSLVAQQESAQKSVELAKKEYYPLLTGNAQYNAGGSQYPLGQGWQAGVNMSVNIFDGFSTTNKVAEAMANKRIIDAKINAMKLQIMLDVKQAFLNLIKAVETISATEVQVMQATETLELANLRYTSGLADPLEVTDATVSYSNARLSNISALYDYKVSQANLEKAMGNK
ncbi:MAG: TolC family protein [Proteobacteria bacterium]|nr:TolC family protein [Pseudomonadota bacterium]